MYSTLVSPKQQPHLASPWSQLRRSKYIESKGEELSERVKARFLMSLRLLGMTKTLRVIEHATPEKSLPLRNENSMPSRPCQYKGELEGVVNTERHNSSIKPSSNCANKKGLVSTKPFEFHDYFVTRHALWDISLTIKIASSPLVCRTNIWSSDIYFAPEAERT